MEFRILGPVSAERDGHPVPLDGAKQRATLAVLLLAQGGLVTDERLTTLLWGWDPPATSTRQLYTYVSRLRTRLGPGPHLTRRGSGYRMDLAGATLDWHTFRELADAGRDHLRAGRFADAERSLAEALGLWHGPALGDVTEQLAQAEGPRLEEARLAALEEHTEAALALGRHDDLVPALTGHVRSHPLRERLRGQLMTALHRGGRQADALSVYDEGRRLLTTDLGIDPGPALRTLHQQILTGTVPHPEAPERPTTHITAPPATATAAPGETPTAEPTPGPDAAVGSGVGLAVAAGSGVGLGAAAGSGSGLGAATGSEVRLGTGALAGPGVVGAGPGAAAAASRAVAGGAPASAVSGPAATPAGDTRACPPAPATAHAATPARLYPAPGSTMPTADGTTAPPTTEAIRPMAATATDDTATRALHYPEARGVPDPPAVAPHDPVAPPVPQPSATAITRPASTVPHPPAAPHPPATTPPGTPARVIPALLPAPPVDFVGRGAEVREVMDALRGRYDVVVAGAPGTGTSALALRVGDVCRGEFPDGQLYADLRTGDGGRREAGEVLDWFLRALGADGDRLPDGVDDRARLFRALVADRRMLIVLDNAADDTQVRPLLPGGGPSRTVVTGTHPTLASLGAVRLVRLGPMAPAEAAELLASVAGAERLAAEPEATLRVAEFCDRLPLALRIAGVRLVTRPHWPVARLADRLAPEEYRLDELRIGALDLGTALRTALHALTPAAAEALGVLAATGPSRLTARDAAALLDLTPRHAEDLLEELTDARLLTASPKGDEAGSAPHGEPCYRLMPLVRLYARQHCPTAARHRPHDRHTAAA
ncbi:BTAD domain-containing putative transcriptional regulator [Streptomyces sp. NRAIS4]